MPTKFYALFVCYFLSVYALKAQQELNFDHLNVESGLSQRSVLSIGEDRRGVMWFGTKYGLNRYNGQSFKVYKNNPNDEKSLNSNEFLTSLLSDKSGRLWVGNSVGLNYYDPENDAFTRVQSAQSTDIKCVFEDSYGNIWVGSERGLWLSTDRAHPNFKRVLFKNEAVNKASIYTIFEDHNKMIWLGSSTGLISVDNRAGHYLLKVFKRNLNDPATISDNHVTSIAEDSQHGLWIGTKYGGLNETDLSCRAFKHFTANGDGRSLINNNIRKILMTKNDRLWIGTQDGLSVLNIAKLQFSNYQHDPNNPKSLSQNSIYDIFQDSHNSIWIGTYFGGINVVHNILTPFQVYQNQKDKNSISSNIISSIVEDRSKNLWIGTESNGLDYYDRKNNLFYNFKREPKGVHSLSSNLVKAILIDRSQKIWIGTSLGGLNLFDPVKKTFVSFKHNEAEKASISSDNVNCLLQDSQNRVWVGTELGLNLLDTKSGSFKLIDSYTRPLSISNTTVNALFEDSRQNIWVGTHSGISLLKKNSLHFNTLYTCLNRHTPGGNINTIFEDSKHRIWIGTYHEGLKLYNPETNSFFTYDINKGLASNNILGMLEDEAGSIWISTDNGLSKFDPQKITFKNYNVKDGLPGIEFNNSSCLKDSKGEMFFGGYDGMVSFFPQKITENKLVPSVMLTELKLFNEPVQINGTDGLLKKDFSLTKNITFNYLQNIFTIEFTSLNYIKSDKNRYAYKLEGFEKNWNYVSNPSATYTNLPFGNYHFIVKGSNNDGVWSLYPASVDISILPPPWKTWWAYVLYSLIAGTVILMLLRYLAIRAKLAKEHELHQMKLNFFTNISHEFRTPLTLILGPLERMLSTTYEDLSINRQLVQIKGNADRLLRLVSELMDFRKAETGHLALAVCEGNIVDFVKEIFLSFQVLASNKNVEFSFRCTASSIKAYYDKNQLEKVIFNLLSNAFKFIPEGGNIIVAVTQNINNTINISVTDNGPGIPSEDQPKIFRDFYQVPVSGKDNLGTGIGLALSKSIVELHQGNLTMTSSAETADKPGCTSFIVELLPGKQHFNHKQLLTDYINTDSVINYRFQQEISFMENEDLTVYEMEDVKFTVLIVEDNIEIRKFFCEVFASKYMIIEAENGLLGWDCALSHMPDLVISDVMMPEMDGVELCAKLKGDERTSHIPVILLTARASYVHQESGFETGADAYIIKPFNVKLLEINIRNLLAARETMRKKYSGEFTLQPSNTLINGPDEKFLNRLMKIIEDHIDDSEFDVDTLMDKIGMSKKVLYKKIHSLTDLTVADFVKSIRLKKAALLLKENRLSIKEITYAVGFNDRKYFSKEFKKQYGKTPSEYIGLPEDVTDVVK